MARKWVGGAVAVVAIFVLAGQCAGDDVPVVVSEAASTPTPTPAPIQPAFAAPATTTVASTTVPSPAASRAPTTRPVPTTRPAPTTTPAPQPAPRPQPRPQPQPAAADAADDDEDGDRVVSYENCDAVRLAGAAPIRRGDPGYARHLDRDGDGVGCGGD